MDGPSHRVSTVWGHKETRKTGEGRRKGAGAGGEGGDLPCVMPVIQTGPLFCTFFGSSAHPMRSGGSRASPPPAPPLLVVAAGCALRSYATSAASAACATCPPDACRNMLKWCRCQQRCCRCCRCSAVTPAAGTSAAPRRVQRVLPVTQAPPSAVHASVPRAHAQLNVASPRTGRRPRQCCAWVGLAQALTRGVQLYARRAEYQLPPQRRMRLRATPRSSKRAASAGSRRVCL
eukprot:289382-Chlamydomonas_euryale.AAC.1